MENVVSSFEHDLDRYFHQIRSFKSLKEFQNSSLYQEISSKLSHLFNSQETGSFAPPSLPVKKSYKAITWNLERGICFEGIIHTLKNHPAFQDVDVFLAPETDLGMARSDNRNIAREMAKELGYNYFFAPCYLNLEKGSGEEAETEENNREGIHGNAIFSRYPMKDFHSIPLKNNKDKLKGKEKRLGNQQGVAATVVFPDREVRVVCLHLDAHSSKRHRRDQIRTVLDYLKKLPPLPTLIGGDFNTTTYNSRHAIFAIFGFWVRVMMGPGYMIRSHYPYPDRFFEKSLFKSLESDGFQYKNLNEPGVCTLHYIVKDLKQMKNLRDWIPEWCFQFIEWALRKNNGRCSFKLDWFAGKEIEVVEGSPKVIGEISYRGKPVSDHDAIVVDFK